VSECNPPLDPRSFPFPYEPCPGKLFFKRGPRIRHSVMQSLLARFFPHVCLRCASFLRNVSSFSIRRRPLLNQTPWTTMEIERCFAPTFCISASRWTGGSNGIEVTMRGFSSFKVCSLCASVPVDLGPNGCRAYRPTRTPPSSPPPLLLFCCFFFLFFLVLTQHPRTRSTRLVFLIFSRVLSSLT